MRLRFRSASAKERRSGSQFLMVGFHPEFEYVPGWPMTSAFRFSSPEFKPEGVRSDRCLGIGCGQEVEALRLAAQDAHAGFSRMRMNARNPGLLGFMIADRLRNVLIDQPTGGLSEWFVFGSITPAGYILEPFSCHTRVEGRTQVIQAPTIMRSYSQFCAFAKERGLVADAAIAM
jgi:hypothetical protein